MLSSLTCKLGRPALRSLAHAIGGFTLAAFGCFCSNGANAQVLLFSANSGEQSFTGTSFVDLNGTASGGSILNFATSSANQRVSIIFDATCYIQDGAYAYAIVTILVDPAGSGVEFAAPPTNNVANNGVVFCFHENGAIGSNSVRASVVATARPSQAGTHTVRVRVRMASLAGDTSLKATLQAMSLTVLR